MSIFVFAAPLLASAAIVQSEPPQLRLYNDVTGHRSPFSPECYRGQQARRYGVVGKRVENARNILVTRYGEEAVDNAYAFINEGPVKRWAPCDRVKQEEFLDRYEAAVAMLEADLTAN